MIANFYKKGYEKSISDLLQKGKITREDAEDIIQEALIKVARDFDVKKWKSFDCYLKKSIRSCYIDFVYKQGKKRIPKDMIIYLSDEIAENLTYEDIISDDENDGL